MLFNLQSTRRDKRLPRVILKFQRAERTLRRLLLEAYHGEETIPLNTEKYRTTRIATDYDD